MCAAWWTRWSRSFVEAASWSRRYLPANCATLSIFLHHGVRPTDNEHLICYDGTGHERKGFEPRVVGCLHNISSETQIHLVFPCSGRRSKMEDRHVAFTDLNALLGLEVGTVAVNKCRERARYVVLARERKKENVSWRYTTHVSCSYFASSSLCCKSEER